MILHDEEDTRRSDQSFGIPGLLQIGNPTFLLSDPNLKLTDATIQDHQRCFSSLHGGMLNEPTRRTIISSDYYTRYRSNI
jgi:hypothetical protein